MFPYYPGSHHPLFAESSHRKPDLDDETAEPNTAERPVSDAANEWRYDPVEFYELSDEEWDS